MNAHLFRHLAAYIFLRQHPGEFETVRVLLGHKSIRTTVSFYCAIEQEDAFRRYDALLDSYRQEDAP
ncbi:hypothetical protein GCM10007036_21420 [Alsobacter metallidurans]|uniref:Tyr recombinase domain-containing protein n=1 Tax=Alsobacter metallidurans TaxID=340221 RepID=A0A917I7I1_9HYPH|nr:hypothetical protein [Alsobacter metallidurans]GGH18924.1 hypothetical protein GCM10007036_21420 [Alsobacter metallidurans]